MARRLPPLNALRAFEAAARHLSFSRAAEELHVTPAAISHQIKALEAWLEVELFRRRGRDVLLTESGQTFFPGLRDGFDRLQSATRRVLALEERRELKVSVLNSFGAKWLMPRLPRFLERHGDIDVLISSSSDLVDLRAENMDVGIRFGNGDYPGLEVLPLFSEDVFPVCSPGLPRPDKPLARPADLANHVLLHDDFDIDWQVWLQAAEVDSVDVTRGPRFSDSGMILQAAAAGQGVALARSSLVSDDLTEGRLIKPFDFSLRSPMWNYLVYPPEVGDQPKVREFRTWLLREAALERGEDGSG